MNKWPAWAAYRTLLYGRLIGIDKHPGVWSVGVGENWWYFMANCVLKVEGQEEKKACGKDQICRGMETCIEGASM